MYTFVPTLREKGYRNRPLFNRSRGIYSLSFSFHGFVSDAVFFVIMYRELLRTTRSASRRQVFRNAAFDVYASCGDYVENDAIPMQELCVTTSWSRSCRGSKRSLAYVITFFPDRLPKNRLLYIGSWSFSLLPSRRFQVGG